MIFLNVILRPSILHACEAYYNHTEAQTRQIEKIELGYLRRIFNFQLFSYILNQLNFGGTFFNNGDQGPLRVGGPSLAKWPYTQIIS